MRRGRGTRGRFRRRRARVTWLPINGIFLTASGEFGSSNITDQLDVPASGAPVTSINFITFDSPAAFDSTSGNLTADSNLGDAIANEYIIRRIVGNIFVSFPWQKEDDNDPSKAQAINVTAGLFVARAESEAVATPQPISSGTEGARWNNYGSHALSTVREPWIWRRQWILGNPAFRARNNAIAATPTTIATPAFDAIGLGSEYPSTNVEYAEGSNQQINQKTIRRIRDDSRLWCVVSAFNTQNVFAVQTVGSLSRINLTWDLRILGALRKAKNTGTF